MTERALDDLIAAVEADDFSKISAHDVKTALGGHYSPWLISATRGDLNAAKSLHEALLPGWGSRRLMSAHGGGFSAEVFPGEIPQTGRQEAVSKHSEARAWLIAILKAFRDSHNDNKVIT